MKKNKDWAKLTEQQKLEALYDWCDNLSKAVSDLGSRQSKVEEALTNPKSSKP